MQPETIAVLMEAATRRLKAAGCETPVLDARLLLQHAAAISREDMILEPARVVDDSAVLIFKDWVNRREAREPVSRILGEREFYGRSFRITPDVLDPRPDTETLIDAALGILPPSARILDLGTGSGAIIVTLLAERPGTTGMATDLSSAALAVAARNAAALGVADRLDLRQGNWFDPVSGQFDVIVSNPPYVPQADMQGLAPDVRDFDPVMALTDGGDGQAAYRAIAAGAAGHLSPGGSILVEIGAGQQGQISEIFAAAGFAAGPEFKDLGGHVRCLSYCQP